MEALPVLDLDRLLRICRGNGERARELVAALIVDAQTDLSELRRAIESGDDAVVTDRAHALKGMSLEVGAPRLAAAATALESAGDTDVRRAGIEAIAAEIAGLQAALTTQLK